METILARRELHIERKYLILELRANERGRYLRICETAAGRRNIVIVPDTGLAEFTRALSAVLAAMNPSAVLPRSSAEDGQASDSPDSSKMRSGSDGAAEGPAGK